MKFSSHLLSPGYKHFVYNKTLQGPWSKGSRSLYVGMGCFWGAERLFWQQKGVLSTSVGYQGGTTASPDYERVCTGQTGHVEVVQIIYDPHQISLEELLILFWENHDPTQGNRQGPDIGTQYRSALYCENNESLSIAMNSREIYQQKLAQQDFSKITTEIALAPAYTYAEDYHQQYLAKNPHGYCSMKGTDISFG